MIATHTTRKAVDGPCEEARAVSRAVDAAGGVRTPLPVVWRNRVLGWTISDGTTTRYLDRLWCGFTSYDDVLSELMAGKVHKATFYRRCTSSSQASVWCDMWPQKGVNGEGTQNGTAKTARQFDDSTASALQHGGDVSPDTKHVKYTFAGVRGYTNQASTLMCYDRVLSYDRCAKGTVNVANNMTNTLTAQRYCGTGEPGLQVSATAYVDGGSATTMNLSYTNQAGTSGRTSASSVLFAYSATGVVQGPQTSGTTSTNQCFLTLQEGDLGVRSIESYTHTSTTWTSAETCYVLAYPLFIVPFAQAGNDVIMDLSHGMNALPRIYDGACVSWFMYHTASGSNPSIYGELNLGWG